VRFLILQTVVSQHVSREKFCFVPDLGEYNRFYTDEYLRKEWGISEEEWNYIDSRIHNYGGDE
jgi:site-specific DNA-methyltransferase (adenine-specific)